MNHGPVPGMLTRAQLGDLIEGGEIETVLTVFPDMYGRLMGKRITGHFFMDHVADDGMHACDYLLACDMEMDVIPGYTNSFDLTPTRQGTFVGKCAELCGVYHSRMLFNVRVVTREEFDDYLQGLEDAEQVSEEPLVGGTNASTQRGARAPQPDPQHPREQVDEERIGERHAHVDLRVVEVGDRDAEAGEDEEVAE